MYIAPGFKSHEWLALELDDPSSPDWQTATDVLARRIYERYIDPVDALIKLESNIQPLQRRFGFTVLAIDCLLVETLGAFLLGLESTDGKSAATFIEFLIKRHEFKAHFDEALAKRFYAEFRCGILHQAEIQGNSKVWSVGPLIRVEGTSLIINRNELHICLSSAVKNYITELSDQANTELRAKFRKKMNFIARS